ncbi:hypothetical protein MPTK1_2g17440 [Marchantia polymorpha subsp. ruderalis]|uniref:Uncharacterized protein n=1 Tax=Marchantia polymorpha TaxID=3197 RepID=A0A2R6WG51_MARPO|nr:hypothetical protein MARPO_0094s0012 [Marchantia polymorpha]BBN02708.1 hypothetical protein Mp_2g17440 [Marchantia polymorpha subsp. ruderalis]|eukprot:PTQ32832.1 hypothetical protein MARPO_0094s0012 [Marchantia polymorpha]
MMAWSARAGVRVKACSLGTNLITSMVEGRFQVIGTSKERAGWLPPHPPPPRSMLAAFYDRGRRRWSSTTRG